MPTATLDDLQHVLAAPQGDVRALYYRAAERYDHFRDLWLAGEPAERAMVEDLRRARSSWLGVRHSVGLDPGPGRPYGARRGLHPITQPAGLSARHDEESQGSRADAEARSRRRRRR